MFRPMLFWLLCLYTSQQLRHLNSDLFWLLSFIGSGITFSLKQPSNFTFWTFKGTPGNASSNTQSFKASFSSLESWFMLLGRLTKLFLLRFRLLNDDKQPISSGTAPSPRLQARKSSSSKVGIFSKRRQYLIREIHNYSLASIKRQYSKILQKKSRQRMLSNWSSTCIKPVCS